MNLKETMAVLERAGTAQTRKVYARHGVGGEMFGVSFAELGKLQKKIKVDQELAEKLWATGNHDARVLAAKIADPAAMRSATLDAWLRGVDNYVLADAFSGLVARSRFADSKRRAWTRSGGEFAGQVGWNLVASLAMRDNETPDRELEDYLEQIEKRIGRAKNRVRYSMNNALIAIGMRNPKLEKKAVAAARRIGPVEVDHGETGCKTPDAVAYIERVKARRRAKKKAG